MESVIQLFGATISSRILGAFFVLWVGTAVAAGIASICGRLLPLATYAVIQDIIRLRIRLNRPRDSFERRSLLYKLQSMSAKKLEDTRPMNAQELLQVGEIPHFLDAVADTVGRRFGHAFRRCETSDEQSAFLFCARKFLMDEVWNADVASPRASVRKPSPSPSAKGKPMAAAPKKAKGAKKVSKKKQAKGNGKKAT